MPAREIMVSWRVVGKQKKSSARQQACWHPGGTMNINWLSLQASEMRMVDREVSPVDK